MPLDRISQYERAILSPHSVHCSVFFFFFFFFFELLRNCALTVIVKVINKEDLGLVASLVSTNYAFTLIILLNQGSTIASLE